jgi:prepilin-type N-terminal cleavage/methylation domain-containing protein
MKRASEFRHGDDARGFTLLEMMVVASLLTVVLAIVGNFLITSERAVANASVHVSDNGNARAAVESLQRTIQFATAIEVSSTGADLYTEQQNGSCDEWFVSSGVLYMEVGSNPASAVVRGVVAPASGTVFTYNSAYPDLVGVQFTVSQNASQDPNGGISVDDNFLGENASLAISQGSAC